MSIVLDQLMKRYGTHLVVNQVSIEVANGEFFVLLGASGSGKSTVLRMIAGLASVDGGRVQLHDRDVTTLPARERNVGLVFQNYALFRHMSVAENVEFALSVRKVNKQERRRRREELLEIVGLSGLGSRFPNQLSGGQQQRVALARALAHQPAVLLLDEPFGALDAPIRAELRRSLLSAHRELGITTIFVTHDQEEAFELGDRIGVMRSGRLLEVGPPRELYFRPRSEYVATFLGSSNLLGGLCDEGGLQLGPITFPLSTESAGGSRQVQVLFRPEDVAVKTTREALGRPLLGQGVVLGTTFSGSTERLRIRLPRHAKIRPISPSVPFGDDSLILEASRSQDQALRFPLHAGDPAWIGVRRLHVLPDPGLSVLVVADESAESRAAFDLGVEIAWKSHARLNVLARESPSGWISQAVQSLRDRMRSGLAGLEVRMIPDGLEEAVLEEADRKYFDLVIRGTPARGNYNEVGQLLDVGHHNVLLVPSTSAVPTSFLICVAVGEPGKEDVRFAGRLARQLEARAAIACVLSPDCNPENVEHAQRFLAAGGKTLSLLEVPSREVVRRGEVREEIVSELNDGGHDLLVIGAPLPNRRGQISLGGFDRDLLDIVRNRPVLIVRSHEN